MDYPGGPKKDTRILILKRQEGRREGRKGNRTVKTKVRVTQVHPSIAGSSSHWKSRGSVPAPSPPPPPTSRFPAPELRDHGLVLAHQAGGRALQQPRGTRVPPRGPLLVTFQTPPCLVFARCARPTGSFLGAHCLSHQTVTTVRAGNLYCSLLCPQ